MLASVLVHGMACRFTPVLSTEVLRKCCVRCAIECMLSPECSRATLQRKRQAQTLCQSLKPAVWLEGSVLAWTPSCIAAPGNCMSSTHMSGDWGKPMQHCWPTGGREADRNSSAACGVAQEHMQW